MPRRRTRREGSGKGIGFWLLILIIGALIGSVVAQIIGLFFHDQASLIYKFFIAGTNLGFEPRLINLYVFDFTFGFHLKLNLFTLLGFIGAIYLGRVL
jgi:hypothetical protein